MRMAQPRLFFRLFLRFLKTDKRAERSGGGEKNVARGIGCDLDPSHSIPLSTCLFLKRLSRTYRAKVNGFFRLQGECKINVNMRECT